jgi:hypothetical protein
MKHCNQHEQIVNTDSEPQKTKLPIFRYSGKGKRKITKLFKETQMKIAF